MYTIQIYHAFCIIYNTFYITDLFHILHMLKLFTYHMSHHFLSYHHHITWYHVILYVYTCIYTYIYIYIYHILCFFGMIQLCCTILYSVRIICYMVYVIFVDVRLYIFIGNHILHVICYILCRV